MDAEIFKSGEGQVRIQKILYRNHQFAEKIFEEMVIKKFVQKNFIFRTISETALWKWWSGKLQKFHRMYYGSRHDHLQMSQRIHGTILSIL